LFFGQHDASPTTDNKNGNSPHFFILLFCGAVRNTCS
jgi:hypothetical protein